MSPATNAKNKETIDKNIATLNAKTDSKKFFMRYLSSKLIVAIIVT